MSWWPPNPTLVRCPSCGSELKLRLPGWKLNAVAAVVWIVFCNWIRGDMPYGLWMLTIFVIAVPWGAAERRLYHAWWRSRHPARCGGHTSLKPAIEGAER